MRFKESDYWMIAICGGLVATFAAAFLGSYDDFRYGALFCLGATNAYRIAQNEQDHEPDEGYLK